MGWCHEFGTQVHLGCDHPMTAGPDSCHCDECGFVCTGKFTGCADVWARGPRVVTLLRPPEAPGRALPPLDVPDESVRNESALIDDEPSSPTPQPELASPASEQPAEPATARWGPSQVQSPTATSGRIESTHRLERLLERAPATWRSRLARLSALDSAPQQASVGGSPTDEGAALVESAVASGLADVRSDLLRVLNETLTDFRREVLAAVDEAIENRRADLGSPLPHAVIAARQEFENSAKEAVAAVRNDITAWAQDFFEASQRNLVDGFDNGISELRTDLERVDAALSSGHDTLAEAAAAAAAERLGEKVDELAPRLERLEADLREQAATMAAQAEAAAQGTAARLGEKVDELAPRLERLEADLREQAATMAAQAEAAEQGTAERLEKVDGLAPRLERLEADLREQAATITRLAEAPAAEQMVTTVGNALSAARDDLRVWFEITSDAARSELRSLLNDALTELRSDVDRLDAAVKGQEAAVEAGSTTDQLAQAMDAALAATRDEVRSWVDGTSTAARGEFRSLINDAIAGIRSDLDQIEADLRSQQTAVAEFGDAIATTRRLADGMEELRAQLTAGSSESRADIGQRLEETLAEARSLMVNLQLGMSAIHAELEELNRLREELAGQLVESSQNQNVPAASPLEELADTVRAGRQLEDVLSGLPVASAAPDLGWHPEAPSGPVAQGKDSAGPTEAPAAWTPEELALLAEPPDAPPELLAVPPVPDQLPPPPPSSRQAPPPTPRARRSPLRRLRQAAGDTRSPRGAHDPAPDAGVARRAGAAPIGWEPGQAPPPSLVEQEPEPASATATESSPPVEQADSGQPSLPGDGFSVDAPLDLPITGGDTLLAAAPESLEAAAPSILGSAPDERPVADEPAPLLTEARPAELGAASPDEAEPVSNEPAPSEPVAGESAEPSDKAAAPAEAELMGDEPATSEPVADESAEPREMETAAPMADEVGRSPETEEDAAPASVVSPPAPETPKVDKTGQGTATQTSAPARAQRARKSERPTASPSTGPSRPRYRSRALNQLVDTWEGVVEQFLQGGQTRSPELEPWFAAYDGEVHYDALPEPFVGPLGARPKAVLLSLNPGPAFAHLHARDGRFAQQIRRAGSYAAWAADGPDADAPYGRKATQSSRLRFIESWLGEPVGATDIVTFELYPWPATSWTSRVELNPVVLGLLDRYVVGPVAALRPPWAFAFGTEWFQALEALGFVERVTAGGDHGPTWPGAAPSRVVTVFEHEGKRLRVVAMRHRGSAGPPKPAEVAPLRDLLGRLFHELDASSSKARRTAKPRAAS